ncbi:MAG: hypothetical protein DRN91_09175 [Candidatus Alkanophagales archaeon]|nr:MAG: hypothetical protein DRN91_09175 [Candidatus Alkanophagales archaeon]
MYKRAPRRLPLSIGYDRYAVVFNGEDAYGEIPNDPSLQPGSGDWTIEVAFEVFSAPPAEVMIFNNYGPSSTPFYALCLESDMDLKTYARDVDNVIVEARHPISLNKLYIAHAIRRGDDFELWLNGSLEASYTKALGDVSSDNDIWIAHHGADRWLDGVVYYVRFYKGKALTADEIKRNIMEYHRPVKSNLTLWLPLDEGAGDKIKDRSGCGNHGTLKGGYSWTSVGQYEIRAKVGL